MAGVVERVGFDVEELAPGDEGFGYIRKDTIQFGANAEHVSAHVRMVARRPAGLSWEQAAGVPLAGLTACQPIKRVAVRAGETVLVHAAAGGVGSLGVQTAVALGARVIGTAAARNHDFVRKLGAEPVTYGPGLGDRVARLAPEGIDAALVFVGADAVDTSPRLLGRPDGLASIAAPEAAEQGPARHSPPGPGDGRPGLPWGYTGSGPGALATLIGRLVDRLPPGRRSRPCPHLWRQG
ncbi:zinc-binding dehydrogenase [Streptomyces sp. NPDC004728]|uniref:zinc-binding dehydrogenase n=1 Tax=Streptomyces sp. NPDC004728 TaxID=3154289 RepID=UPI0033B9F15D